ncbi:hypothetical protein PQ610_02065 [Tardisphaera miroshnichenkoae]
MAQIFVSHSRRDEDIRQWFDTIFATAGVRAVRMEFEDAEVKSGRMILQKIRESDALFVLMGPNLTFSQFTENWIGFEVGAAAALTKPVWVFERILDSVMFPIPYLTHYVLYDPRSEEYRVYVTDIVKQFNLLLPFRNFGDSTSITCPYEDCRSEYDVRPPLPAGSSFICPSCRRQIKIKRT